MIVEKDLFIQSLLDGISSFFNIRRYELLWTEEKKNSLVFKFKAKQLAILEILMRVGEINEEMVASFFLSLDSLVADYMKPRLEEFYGQPVVQFFFTPSDKSLEEESRHVVVVFAKNICTESNRMAREEDAQARVFAKKLKDTAQRGARSTKCYIYEKRALLFVLEGFLAPVEYDFVGQRNFAAFNEVVQLIEHILLVTGRGMLSENGRVPTIITKYDSVYNRGMVFIDWENSST